MTRTACILAGVLAVCFGWSATHAGAAEPAKRNILVLVADDLGLDLGCYGNTKIKMPHLDALAAQGVRFSHAFASTASCSPSRSVMYTGLHTHASGQYGLAHANHHQHTFANVRSLPRLLRDAGYLTGILGKNHVIPQAVYPWEVEIVQGLEGNRNVAEMARRAGQFFTQAGDKPFILVVGFSDPHRSAKNFGNEKPYKDVPEVKYDPKDVIVPYHLPDRPEVREELAEYYQSSSRMDQGVGLILKALKDAKKDDSTLIIFLSDNGIPFPGAKTTQYDAGLRLPLIIASPTQKRRGLTNAALASFVDITPTILDWAGVKASTPMHGRSLLPILEEENPKGWDTVFGSHQFHEITMYYPMRTIRTRDFKLILNLAHGLEYPFSSDIYGSRTWQGILKRKDTMLGLRSIESFTHRPKEELFDLRTDPNELKNVVNDPKYTDTLRDLRTRLRQWQESTNDPWVIKYTHE